MENEKMRENTIDLDMFMRLAVIHKKEIGAVIIGCTVLGAIIAFALPKQYESTTLVQTRSADKNFGGAAAMASMMGISGSSVNPAYNYIELMKSRTVLEPVIESLDWDEEKKKPSAQDFAKNNLRIENTKQTNLITVTAIARTPEDAQMISQGVVDNFLTMQTDNGKKTQSTLVKFLNERISDAKKDADDARTKFAEYQQVHKVYSPDEQAKAIVEKMNAFDKAISDIGVQKKASQAKLDAVSTELHNINAKSQNFNINDNENVMHLRKQIVDAQVALVGLRERYTDEHPSIISAKGNIEALQKQLAEEVNTVVASKYTTMNPTQAALVGEQANAQVSMAVAEASEVAIRAHKEEQEKELEKFPRDVLEYLNLQRDTAIKEEIYTNLVKQCEQDKIQEAMESMDIQIIDKANLPNKPSAPNKKIITVIGFVIGIILSIVYTLIKYKKEII